MEKGRAIGHDGSGDHCGDSNGAFKSRKDLLKVPRLGDKTFEQCAGFLRISDGEQPLDASSVHPEAYPVVERILKQCGREVKQIIGDASLLRAPHAKPRGLRLPP